MALRRPLVYVHIGSQAVVLCAAEYHDLPQYALQP
jgi:hypothetical protein